MTYTITEAQRQQLLSSLQAIHIDFVCQAAHHAKKDQHHGLAECPIVRRHSDALSMLQSLEHVKGEPDCMVLEEMKAVLLCQEAKKVSVSMVQRKLNISYGMAQRLCQSIIDKGCVPGLQISPSLSRAVLEKARNE